MGVVAHAVAMIDRVERTIKRRIQLRNLTTNKNGKISIVKGYILRAGSKIFIRRKLLASPDIFSGAENNF